MLHNLTISLFSVVSLDTESEFAVRLVPTEDMARMSDMVPSGATRVDLGGVTEVVDVQSERRVIVTKGKAIVWFNIYEDSGGRILTVCGTCREFEEVSLADDGLAWANRHAGRRCVKAPDGGFAVPAGANRQSTAVQVCGQPTANGGICQNRVRGTQCAAGHRR